MTEQSAGLPEPAVPDVAQLRELTVHGRAVAEHLRALSGAAGESSVDYARLRAQSAAEAWQYVREGVAEQDANSFVLGFRSLLATTIPLADAPQDLRAEADALEQELRGLAGEYGGLLLPLFNANGQGLRPDAASALAQRLPELADLV